MVRSYTTETSLAVMLVANLLLGMTDAQSVPNAARDLITVHAVTTVIVTPEVAIPISSSSSTSTTTSVTLSSVTSVASSSSQLTTLATFLAPVPASQSISLTSSCTTYPAGQTAYAINSHAFDERGFPTTSTSIVGGVIKYDNQGSPTATTVPPAVLNSPQTVCYTNGGQPVQNQTVIIEPSGSTGSTGSTVPFSSAFLASGTGSAGSSTITAAPPAPTSAGGDIWANTLSPYLVVAFALGFGLAAAVYAL